MKEDLIERLANSTGVLRRNALSALRERDFFTFLGLFSSEQRFKPFLKIEPFLTDGEYWPLLAEVWSMIEVSQPDATHWLRLFKSKRGGRETLMTAQERDALAALAETFEIWRGCGDKGGVYGLSWTLNVERAEFFSLYACSSRRSMLSAGYRGKVPTLAHAICHKSAVLAHFLGREEQEIVVDPSEILVKDIITNLTAPADARPEQIEAMEEPSQGVKKAGDR